MKWKAQRTGPARPLVAATLSSRGGKGLTPRGDARLGLGLCHIVRLCDGAACGVSAARLESDSSGSEASCMTQAVAASVRALALQSTGKVAEDKVRGA